MTESGSTGAPEAVPDAPLTTLRGAGVDFNTRRIGQVLIGLVLATLATLAVVFTVAGAHQNDQINQLRQHGVKVVVTSTGCLGLLGGSGSNAAGYACKGSFTLEGHTYTENIPGNTLLRPGSTLEAVTVPGDPSLLSPVGTVAHEHASGSVYILPLALLGALVLLAGGLALRRRRSLQATKGTAVTR